MTGYQRGEISVSLSRFRGRIRSLTSRKSIGCVRFNPGYRCAHPVVIRAVLVLTAIRTKPYRKYEHQRPLHFTSMVETRGHESFAMQQQLSIDGVFYGHILCHRRPRASLSRSPVHTKIWPNVDHMSLSKSHTSENLATESAIREDFTTSFKILNSSFCVLAASFKIYFELGI